MEIDFKSLDTKKFENLCKRLLILENPKTQTIDGSGGDDGVDSFVGIFNGDIRVWQFKYFLDRLSSSRKKQIEKSLKTAKEKHKLKEWILCLPMEFSKSETKWFQEITKRELANKIKLSCVNEHHLRNLIQKHKDVRDAFFRGEEKSQLNRMEKAIMQIKKEGTVFKDDEISQKYTEQISAFKLDLVNIDPISVIDYLKKSLPFRRGLGFKKFNKVSNSFFKTLFFIPIGNSILRLNLEDEENPFKLTVPYSMPVEIWIKRIISEDNPVPKTQLTCFTSHGQSKSLLLKVIEESLPDSAIMNEVSFNTKMKGLVSDRRKFALSTTTVKLDPNIIEKVSGLVRGQNIDVEIRSNIIHSKKGGLPKTKFMQKALSLVKTIRKESKISDIIFFRAKQTSRVVTNELVTVEIHNDGRVRIWFKKSIKKNKQEMMIELAKFIDSIA